MSQSLTPWIAEFLVKLGEDYGAKPFDAPPFTKKKRVQITEVRAQTAIQQGTEPTIVSF